ncbi:hypothetical protein JHK85_022682 [Glycine max]|nr:hypothetical protein JHK85_022682 [Glycine max]
MAEPSPPPPLAPPPPPQSTPPRPQPADSVRVRCAGCRMILTVAPGLTEFACPTCRMPQMLPPELMPKAAVANVAAAPLPPTSAPPSQPSQAPAHGIDPTKIQLPCASCKAILNVPHGLPRFACPQCGVDLAVDVSKVKQFFPAPLLPEEVNEVTWDFYVYFSSY